jgi:CPA2 family monovalent cation:H+ antiporter-2
MEASFDPSTLKVALIVLAAAAIVIPAFHRLRISPVLGFMLVGAAVGPYSLGRLAEEFHPLAFIAVEDPRAIAPVAQFGVVFLMFMIGLELSFERLWTLRRLVFGLGPAQVVGSTALLAGVLRLCGIAGSPAIVLALAGAMSSTAIVIQVLSEEKRLSSSVGRAAFAILLFQDLAVVPILFVLGLLGTGIEGEGVAGLWLAAVQAVAAVGGILAVGRLALRPLMRGVARTHSPDLFMAACLLVVLACALATDAAGVSMALGALIGGLLLAGTEYRRQVEVTIEPFKGLLLGVFLISVGMGVDGGRILAFPGTILGGAVVLVLAQAALIAPMARAFGIGWGAALETALLLGPAGEFSFVILAVAVAAGLLPPAVSDNALAVAALTMASIPLLARLARPLARAATGSRRIAEPIPAEPIPQAEAPRVIIAGFGRVGQTVASMLEAHKIPYVALDRDPDRVARERQAGKPVFWGDMTQTALLRRLEFASTRALVITLDSPQAVDSLVIAARAERADLLIVARARDARHAAHLYQVGASDAVPEATEASLQLAEAVLVDVGIPMGPVIASIHQKREELQASIKALAPQAEVREYGRRRLRDAARPEAAGRP